MKHTLNSLIFLSALLFLIALLGSCVSWDAVRSYAAEKAARLAECQAQDPLSADRAKACLGQYARDLGTQACGEAEAWLETLPETEDAEK